MLAMLVDTLKLFFCVVQGLLLALAVSVFCSITRWIPNVALGYQATVYTPLLGYNFLCIVMMFNSKWLHGSLPKLTTVSRACRAWCMSGGVEASRLYLAAVFTSKRWVLGLDLTFLLDWKKMGLGQWYFEGGGVLLMPRGWCWSLFCSGSLLIVMFSSSVWYRKLKWKDKTSNYMLRYNMVFITKGIITVIFTRYPYEKYSLSSSGKNFVHDTLS